MATGVTAYEKRGSEAVTAARLDRDPHALPGPNDRISISYPNKLDEALVLNPLMAEFRTLNPRGKIVSAEISANALVLADNLFGLHSLLASKNRFSLIYLDPPYGTGMEFQSRESQHAYKDTQTPAAYLEFMRRRLILMRELLTEDGSIYLHIGHQMLFHLKAMMDEIFGAKNFRNLIVRRKCSSKNFTRKQYPNLCDYILFYTRSSNYKWHQPYEEASQEWITKEYQKVDSDGQYKLVPIHAPGVRMGETGSEWHGMMPPPGKHWQFKPSKLDELDKAGHIHWSKNGNPRRKVYLDANKKLALTDYWSQFRDAHHQSVEITGYPTEKNLELMKVIISSVTDPGDLVLDPFCGSGTTLHAANDLERAWIGIDESFTAIGASLKRMRHGLKPMGDYVPINNKKGNQEALPFGNEIVPSSDRQRGTLSKEFAFLFDYESIKAHETKIRELDKI